MGEISQNFAITGNSKEFETADKPPRRLTDAVACL